MKSRHHPLQIAVGVGMLGQATLAWAAPVHLELETGKAHESVAFTASFLDWVPRAMTEDQPGHYIASFEAPWASHVEYKFVVNGQWISDPANPDKVADQHGGFNSVLPDTGFREDPLLKPQSGAPALTETKIELTDLEGAKRSVTVLSPSDGGASMTVYFQDGGDYLESGGAAALLANLNQQPGFPTLTGVFIPPKDRDREYELLPAYADFTTQVVVPAIEKRWPRTGGSRTHRLLVGPSLGGLITLFTALRSPEVFGNAASESGSLWYANGALLGSLGHAVAAPERRLKIYMDCGTYESELMNRFNRRGFEAAKRAGQDVVYRQYPSKHDWVGWRNRLQAILRYFFADVSP